MERGLYIAASGGLKQEKMMEVVANNLANINNNGFKRDIIAFEAVLPDFNNPPPEKISAGTPPHPRSIEPPTPLYPTVAQLKTDFSPGPVIQTGNPLDVSLEGKGFFVVKTVEGIRYQRVGSFQLSEAGDLITPEGNLVMGENGGIKILPAGKDITIDQKGKIVVGGGLASTMAGKLKVVDFPDYNVLEKEGMGLFREVGVKESTAMPTENTKVIQGGLETSNVNVAAEMINMIEVTRGYQSYQKVIQTIDGMNNKSVNEVGRVS